MSRCKICGGPVPPGFEYHGACFLNKVNSHEETQKKKKTTFYSEHVREEEYKPPQSIEDFEKIAAEARRKLEEEEIDKRLREEHDRRLKEQAEREAKQKADEARRTTYGAPFGQGYEWRFDPNDFFNNIFGDRFGRRGGQQKQQEAKASWDPAKGNSETVISIAVSVDKKRILNLLMLCHPDKHDNSGLSTEVTRWLNDIKDSLDKEVKRQKGE